MKFRVYTTDFVITLTWAIMTTNEITGSYESEDRAIQEQNPVEAKLAALRRVVEARIRTARDSYIVSNS